MNEQAEEILIGSILKDNSILDEVTLLPEHFLNVANRNIFKAMLNIKKKGFPIDSASIKDELGESGFFFIGGNEILTDYKRTVASVHAFKSYERMIMNTWKVTTSRDLLQSALNDDLTVDKVQSLIKELSTVDEEAATDEFSLKDHLSKMYDLVTVETPKQRSGIPSGFKDIDDKTDGFQKNDLIIVGARPSIGKTAFLLNLAINAGLKNAIPIIFSLEMSAESLIKRMISSLAEINGMKLKNPYHYLNDAEKTKWIERLGLVEKIAPYIYDGSKQRVAEIRAKIRKVKNENKGRQVIVFIDYLTLIKPSQDFKGNAHAEITDISADLKATAKDFKCPVICLAQLSRAVEKRDDKRPKMSDLRESGSIEQDADVVMLLYREDYYNENAAEEDKNVLEVDVAKNRDGEVGRVRLLYKKEINKIENLYHYHKQKVTK